MHRATLCLVLLSFAGTACGGSSDPAELTEMGYKALAQGDHVSATEDFEKALAAMPGGVSHTHYLRAKMGVIEARTKGDPAKAREEFLALHSAQPTKISDRDFARIGGRLGDSGHFEEAILVVESGKGAFPESQVLVSLVQKLGDQAAKGGASDVLEALKGLGYVGD